MPEEALSISILTINSQDGYKSNYYYSHPMDHEVKA